MLWRSHAGLSKQPFPWQQGQSGGTVPSLERSRHPCGRQPQAPPASNRAFPQHMFILSTDLPAEASNNLHSCLSMQRHSRRYQTPPATCLHPSVVILACSTSRRSNAPGRALLSHRLPAVGTCPGRVPNEWPTSCTAPPDWQVHHPALFRGLQADQRASLPQPACLRTTLESAQTHAQASRVSLASVGSHGAISGDTAARR